MNIFWKEQLQIGPFLCLLMKIINISQRHNLTTAFVVSADGFIQPSALYLPRPRATIQAGSLKAHWFHCIWNKIWNKAASHRTVSLGKHTSSVLCDSLHNSNYTVILLLQCPSLFSGMFCLHLMLWTLIWGHCIVNWSYLPTTTQEDCWPP